ncbi:extracellular solute-binding protein [Paenibacillus contaminans]|uniref:ABC transporter substrate-binding protein n=1 Tax=Paenibacillus contaminans TaxID=450362 RepID=A0A329MHB4_9BACL|nr:extracellular solute-binding protein [Paenibacillus contaminans]RAV18746.1 ABC transporter substrate-binding protein [Paenibacillus contaminans]
MSRKNWILFTGTAFLTATLMSGCSSGNTGESGGKDSPSPAATNGGSEKPANAKKPEKVYIYANSGNLTLAANLSKPEDLEMVKQKVIDEIGIEIVPVIPPKGQEGEKLNLLLASNEPVDIFAGDILPFQRRGAIQPLNELLDKYGSDVRKLWPKEWGDSWKALTSSDGKIWGVPSVPALATKAVFVRSDWLKKLNLPMPKTIDEYENVLKALKESDPAGSGQTIPMITNLVGLNLALAAGYMDVGYGSFLDKDGKVKPSVLHPGYKEFVARMADWYKKGYIYKETFVMNYERTRELIKQNRIGSAAIHASNITGVEYDLQKNVPEAKYETAGEMKGPAGNATTMSDISTGGYMISKNAKNPEGAMKLLNWVHSDLENYLLLFYGIKDRNWKYVDEKNHVLEAINKDYVGELLLGDTFAYTLKYMLNDPIGKPEMDYLMEYSGDTSRVKKSGISDVSFKFDQAEIASSLPNRADLQRMMDEEVVKFIIGARPMSEYDKFLQGLNDAGLSKWIDVYTDQYNKAKAAS